MLDHLGVADTPENREQLTDLTKAEVLKRAPHATIIVREEEAQ